MGRCCPDSDRRVCFPQIFSSQPSGTTLRESAAQTKACARKYVAPEASDTSATQDEADAAARQNMTLDTQKACVFFAFVRAADVRDFAGPSSRNADAPCPTRRRNTTAGNHHMKATRARGR